MTYVSEILLVDPSIALRSESKREIAFIDPAIDDLATLRKGIRPSAIDETAQLHPFPDRSSVANSIALLIEENEKLRRLAALLTSQLEVMRGQSKRKLSRPQ
jgi:hypothetical protein